MGGIILGGTYGAEAWTVTSQGNMVYVGGARDPWKSSGVYSIDVSNPNQPLLRDHFISEDYSMTGGGDIAVIGNHVVAAEGTGLWIVDASDSSNVLDAGFFPTGGYAYKVAPKSDFAFTTNYHAGLWIIDISNPSNPQNISNVQTGEPATELLVDSDYVYVVMGKKLVICDVTDIYYPSIVTTYGDGIEYIDKAGDLIYATHEKYENTLDTAFEVIDVSNVTAPFPIGWYNSLYKPRDILIKDSICYMATQDGELRIIDVRTPSFPIEIGHLSVTAFGLTARDSLLYASAGYLYSINIANANNPLILDTLYVGGSEVDMAISGQYLYWVNSFLKVIDISNPYEPQIVFSLGDNMYGIAAKHDTVVATNASLGVRIFKNTRVTTIKEQETFKKRRFDLMQNYPNPFNNITKIRFYVPEASLASLELFNILGQKVRTILSRNVSAGHHSVNLDLTDLASGVYLYRLTANGHSITKKLCLIK